MEAIDVQAAVNNRQSHGAAIGRVQHLAPARCIGEFDFRRSISLAAAYDGPLGRAPGRETRRMALVTFRVGFAQPA